MREDRYGNISTSYKTVIIEYRGTTARGVTSRVLFYFRIKDPLPNHHPYTTTPTQLAKGGGAFLRGVSPVTLLCYTTFHLFSLSPFSVGEPGSQRHRHRSSSPVLGRVPTAVVHPALNSRCLLYLLVLLLLIS